MKRTNPSHVQAIEAPILAFVKQARAGREGARARELGGNALCERRWLPHCSLHAEPCVKPGLPLALQNPARLCTTSPPSRCALQEPEPGAADELVIGGLDDGFHR